ncbi:kinase-like domain-containing protein [Radiomyces spectabilis]|uniref:kinase-like domain-containing protein n=1 Tax=Radiomyces spectabilis TaxID=64574 RepID=UPI00221EBC4B|nr:kinase-like domain-containing protein [Radiomyces spectabilis]KAI8377781.1 kinase-like domain-containing protein [Radiomyces spectabilis]
MTSTATSTKRTRPDNWEAEFYKNGYPKEVIVIEDTPTPPPEDKLQHTVHLPPATTTTTADAAKGSTVTQDPSSQYYLPPPSASTRSKRARKVANNNGDAQVVLAVKNGASTNTAKRRRKENGQSLNVLNQVSYPTYYSAASQLYPPIANHPPTPEPYDDKDGHYIIRPNESLTPRYKMMRLLGQGTFGKVVECYDRVRRTFCAVKIIRAIPKYRDASKIEIRVLNTLKEHDPLNLNKCIHLLEWFDYRNHICMVFELLGQSVFDFLKSNEFHPFPSGHIQQFAKQLLTSVAFVHDLKLIHTDLKPENILLVNHYSRETPSMNGKRAGCDKILQSTEIRLIDFGSATFENDYHSSVVSTRHYRAPEIILGMGWSYPCDIWSIGCILVEFFTGDALFQTHDNLEHLAMMEVVLGRLPPRIIKSASRDAQNFFKDYRLKYPNASTTRQSQKYVQALKSLDKIITPPSTLNRYFLDLLQKMLVYDPAQRITAREALRHPFFHVSVDDQGRELVEG